VDELHGNRLVAVSPHAQEKIAILTHNSFKKNMQLPPIAPYTRQRLPSEKITRELVFPVLGVSKWRASYNEDWGTHRHTGADIPAPKHTKILAPLSGVIGFKTQTFWIIDQSGWGCLGTHLNDDTPGTRDNAGDFRFMFAPELRVGDRVVAGQHIGYVGDSGDASGPHLHFELHSPDGLRDPGPSLRNATHFKNPVAPQKTQPPKIAPLATFPPTQQLDRHTPDPRLGQIAAEELQLFATLSTNRWVRTSSMALGPLRMHGVVCKLAVIIGQTGTLECLLGDPMTQLALKNPGLTRFGIAAAATSSNRQLLILCG
jgi:hypothetical protein